MLRLGDTALVTTDEWFFAPDGDSYKAVFGTIKAIRKDDELLQIETNRHSTNWYLEIGNMTIAGCQINYAVKTKSCHTGPIDTRLVLDNDVRSETVDSKIYDADKHDQEQSE